MRFISLPNIPIGLSRIALGSTYFGTTIPKTTAFSLLDTFATHNGTTIDTARLYGQDFPGGPGASEEVIGEWLRETGMRKHMVIVSKGLNHDLNRKSRYSEKNLWQDLNQSRDALGCETLDLYFLHRDDCQIPVGEIMEMMAPVVTSGAARAIGASNWSIERIEKANEYAATHNLPEFVASEIQWSLAVSTPASFNDETLVCMNDLSLAWYLKKKLPVFAYSPQAKGLFSKVIANGMDNLSIKIRNRFINETNLKRIEQVRQLSKERDLSPAAIVMGYLASHEHPTIAIAGCSNTEQLQDSLIGGNTTITQQERDFLLR
jgi:aryl-alcohol dehydrogenase-like predicted oxidoreductase